MQIGTRETLLATRTKVKQLTFNDTTYFIRELTVGEVNQFLFGQQQEMIKLAEAQGIKLDFDNEETLSKQLGQLYDPYKLARTLAMRLCDEKGNNLFDVNNQADLEALSRLDKGIFDELSSLLKDDEPKNLPNAEDSN